MSAPSCLHASRPHAARTVRLLVLVPAVLLLAGCAAPPATSLRVGASALSHPARHAAPATWQVGTVSAPSPLHPEAGTPLAWLATASGVWAAAANAPRGRRVSIWYAPWSARATHVRFGPRPRFTLAVAIGPHQVPALLGSPTPASVLLAVENTTGPDADVAAAVWWVGPSGAIRLADLAPAGTRPAFVRGETVAVAGAGLVVLGVGARSGPPGPYVPAFTEVIRVGVGHGTAPVLSACRLRTPTPPADLWPVPETASGKPWLLRVSGTSPVTLALLPACPPAAAQRATTQASQGVHVDLPRGAVLLWPMLRAEDPPRLVGWVTLQGGVLAGWQRLADGRALLRWRLVAPDSLVVPTGGPLALLGQASGRWLPVDLATGKLGPALPAGTLLAAQGGAALIARGSSVLYARVRVRLPSEAAP